MIIAERIMRVMAVLYFDLAGEHIEVYTCGKSHSVVHLVFVHLLYAKYINCTSIKCVKNQTRIRSNTIF